MHIDFENAILRHQVAILRRQVKRPVYRTSDKAFLAAASRMLRREAWGTFLVREGFSYSDYLDDLRFPGRPGDSRHRRR